MIDVMRARASTYALLWDVLLLLAAALTPPAASAHEDSYMYLWSDQAQVSGKVLPNPTYSWNALGGLNQVEGLGVGRYRLLFHGLPSDIFGGFRGRQVTAYGSSSDYCLVEVSSPQTEVACFDAGGSPSDGRFLAFEIGANVGGHGEFAMTTAGEPQNPSYNPSGWTAGDTTSGTVTVTRSGVGSYAVHFAGFASVGTGGGNVQVTARNDPVYGPGNRCVVSSWSAETVNVRCFDPAGSAADTAFDVLFQRAASDLKAIAFAWADQEASASYTPDPTYSFNPTGGAVSAQRSSTGVYSLTWAGMGGVGLGGGHVQVTAYGSSDHRCKVASWFGDSISVRCFDTTGNPVDTRYTAIYRKPLYELFTRHFAAASVLNPQLAQSTPSDTYKWSPMYPGDHPDAVIVTRLGTGHHEVQFTRMDWVGEDGGNAQVTALATSPPEFDGYYCKIEGWFGDTVTVRCFDEGGNAADKKFDVVFFKAGPGEQIAYVWANDESSASYTPTPLYARNPSGGAVTAQRLATGHYRVTFTGLGAVGDDQGLPVVSAYGTGNEQCQLLSWSGDLVDVLCFGPGGAAADSRFSLAWFKPDENMDGLAYGYADLENTASYAPPASKAHNPTGQPIAATRATTGEYGMEWTQYEEHGFGRDFHLSSAVGTDFRMCRGGADFGEYGGVCYGTASIPADTEYAVVHLKAIPLPEPVGLAQRGALLSGLGLALGLRRLRISAHQGS